MAKVPKTYRFDEELVARVAAYAGARGSTATDVFAAGAELLLGLAEGGVPELPAPEARVERARRAAPVMSARELLRDGVAMERQARLNAAKAAKR